MLLVAIFIGLSAKPVFAYIDPGTGSYFFQVIVAVFLGGVLYLKVFWRKAVGFFRQLFSRKKHVS